MWCIYVLSDENRQEGELGNICLELLGLRFSYLVVCKCHSATLKIYDVDR